MNKWYWNYLQSPLWKIIRSRKLSKNPNCELCGELANQVHHTEYTDDVLDGRDDSKLVSICGPCHKMIEFDIDGNKQTVDQKKKSTNLIQFSERNKAQADENYKYLVSKLKHKKCKNCKKPHIRFEKNYITGKPEVQKLCWKCK